MRILYVEDHPANLFLIQRVARMGNHEVINYTDGQTALDHFDADKPDLVLMDVQLPGKLNGLDVVKSLRAAGHKLPIIAVTAYAMMGDKERCLEAGCDGYIAKPMPIGELVDLMKRYEQADNAEAVTSPAGTSAPIQANAAEPTSNVPEKTSEATEQPNSNQEKSTPPEGTKIESEEPLSTEVEKSASPQKPVDVPVDSLVDNKPEASKSPEYKQAEQHINGTKEVQTPRS